MIIGIGVDVVHVHRLDHWITIPGLLERYFHPHELETARSRGHGMAVSLAARFAAKEAFGKALGTGLKDIVLRDIMVLNRHNGRPEIVVFGTALAALQRCGANKIHLSLTHEHDNAIAMIVLEQVDERADGRSHE